VKYEVAETGGCVISDRYKLCSDLSAGHVKCADNFYVSDSVNVEKVRFKNLYQMEMTDP